jgi:hypothetical protein
VAALVVVVGVIFLQGVQQVAQQQQQELEASQAKVKVAMVEVPGAAEAEVLAALVETYMMATKAHFLELLEEV